MSRRRQSRRPGPELGRGATGDELAPGGARYLLSQPPGRSRRVGGWPRRFVIGNASQQHPAVRPDRYSLADRQHAEQAARGAMQVCQAVLPQLTGQSLQRLGGTLPGARGASDRPGAGHQPRPGPIPLRPQITGRRQQVAIRLVSPAPQPAAQADSLPASARQPVPGSARQLVRRQQRLSGRRER